MQGVETDRAGLAAAVGCYPAWGFIPLAFQQMARLGADPWEILAHRSVWGALCAGVLVLAARQGRQVVEILRNRVTVGWLVLSTVLIGTNWAIYVSAVNHGHALEASLGYFLNPLLNMVAGSWLFQERLDRFGGMAISLAAVGVVVQAAALGSMPWIALVLATTFCAYGVIRKRIPVDAQAGLFVECAIMMVPGALWALSLEGRGTGHFQTQPAATIWLLLSGPLTAIPMALFSWSARRLPLSTMGFLQFISPSLVFFIGAAQGEPLGAVRMASFAMIWLGIAVYCVGIAHRARHARLPVSRPG